MASFTIVLHFCFCLLQAFDFSDHNAVSMGGVYYRHAVPTFLSPAGIRVQRPQHTNMGGLVTTLLRERLFSTGGIDHRTLNMGGVVTT